MSYHVTLSSKSEIKKKKRKENSKLLQLQDLRVDQVKKPYIGLT